VGGAESAVPRQSLGRFPGSPSRIDLPVARNAQVSPAGAWRAFQQKQTARKISAFLNRLLGTKASKQMMKNIARRRLRPAWLDSAEILQMNPKTGNNVRVFPALLQDRREVLTDLATVMR
jgi:hypothetical protein